MNLEHYGWTAAWSESFAAHRAEDLIPGRVLFQSHGICRVVTEQGEVEARSSGRLRHRADSVAALPLVGDWVALRTTADGPAASIIAVLPRRSRLSRKAAGKKAEEQAVVANVDRVLLMMGLDANFNPRRMERLLAMAWEGDVEPVILLNKADLCETAPERRLELESIAPGVPVLALSVLTGEGLEGLETYLEPYKTIALMGSSGVGKSSLINRLNGNAHLTTGEVRASDGRGRHTTTNRQMFRLPGGSLLIDNPGVRELGMWGTEAGLGDTFSEVHLLAEDCRFRDCTHGDEPGCAVLEAVETGVVSAVRLQSFRTLQKELRSLDLRRDSPARREEKRRVASIHRAVKKHKPRD